MRFVATLWMLISLFLLTFDPQEVNAQQCDLSGKRIYFKNRYCLSTGCFDEHQGFSVVGSKLLFDDEAHGKFGGSGRVYYLGKITNLTTDPIQKDNPGNSYRPGPNTERVVYGGARYIGQTLEVIDRETWGENHSITLIAVISTKIDIEPDCHSCRESGKFNAWRNGRREEVSYSGYSCQISDMP